MKITKRQLRKIIRENVDGFSGRLAMTNGIRDAIVDDVLAVTDKD